MEVIQKTSCVIIPFDKGNYKDQRDELNYLQSQILNEDSRFESQHNVTGVS